MTDAEKIRLLTEKLQEVVNENDRLRAELANLTEGANAHQTLQSLYRNRDLPESLRAKAASAALGHESPPLKSVEPAIDVTCEEVEPLAELVHKRRARQNLLEQPHRLDATGQLPPHQSVEWPCPIVEWPCPIEGLALTRRSIVDASFADPLSGQPRRRITQPASPGASRTVHPEGRVGLGEAGWPPKSRDAENSETPLTDLLVFPGFGLT
jgi:hypothetical protein